MHVINTEETGRNHLFHKWMLLIAFNLYVIAAYNSLGYYHYDEHYQIIEFAGLKLGNNHPDDLAWEYEARLRPAFQPALAYSVFKVAQLFGVNDAYSLAFILRLLTALLSLCAIRMFVKSSLKWMNVACHRPFIVLSYFLWFLPFLNVRFSSESWSGLFFLMAVAIVQQSMPKKSSFLFFVGILLGLSFLCRFQAAFLIVGLCAWLVIIQKLNGKALFLITFSFLLVVLLGIGVDSWFYGELVFTPWNYFKINLVEGVAAEFGTAPWHFYLNWLLLAPLLPIGLLLYISLLILIYKKPKHIILWITLPFLIAHSLISHKEHRFLFPLINFCPLLLILGWQEVKGYFNLFNGQWFRFLAFAFLIFLGIINIAALAKTSSTAAGSGTKAITYFIDKKFQKQEVQLICQPGTRPYNPLYWIPLQEGFYGNKDVTEIDLEEALAHPATSINSSSMLWVFSKSVIHEPQFLELKEKYHLKQLSQSMPEWAEWINQYYNPLENKQILVLYGID